MLELSDHLKHHLPQSREFDAILSMRGEVFREHKNRRTMRVSIGGRDYFLKIHGPTAWSEIVKNAARGRWPVLTAETEWLAIKRLEDLGIPTTPAAGIGIRGRWPAALDSFLITEALPSMIHLSELPERLRKLKTRQRTRIQRTLIDKVAGIARKLHMHGLNHRDFYLCHFMIADRDWSAIKPHDDLIVHVIDLHRVQIRRNTPSRWAIKDISGLKFSAMDADLTSRDDLRFLQAYWRAPWRSRWNQTGAWRRSVIRRAVNLYRSEHGRSPQRQAAPASFA